MTGRRTSLYVPADLTEAADAAKKAGRSLTDILRAGFAAEGFTEPPLTRTALREELAPVLAAIKASGKTARALADTECKHPGVRPKNRCPECHQYNV